MPIKMDGMLIREPGTIQAPTMEQDGAITMEAGMPTIITGGISLLIQQITVDGELPLEQTITAIGQTQMPTNGEDRTTLTIGSQRAE